MYLYLPPTSNHPPKMTKAIIYQLLKKYKNQNTDHENYLKYSVLYRRHKMRSHQTHNLRKYFLLADKKLHQKETTHIKKNLQLNCPSVTHWDYSITFTAEVRF